MKATAYVYFLENRNACYRLHKTLGDNSYTFILLISFIGTFRQGVNSLVH